MIRILLLNCALLLSWSHATFASDSTFERPHPDLGKKVFDQWCAMCHADAPRMPGTASLEEKYKGSLPAALEKRTDMTPEFIEHFVRRGVMIMPGFRKSEITDTELKLLIDYLTVNNK